MEKLKCHWLSQCFSINVIVFDTYSLFQSHSFTHSIRRCGKADHSQLLMIIFFIVFLLRAKDMHFPWHQRKHLNFCGIFCCGWNECAKEYGNCLQELLPENISCVRTVAEQSAVDKWIQVTACPLRFSNPTPQSRLISLSDTPTMPCSKMGSWFTLKVTV